MNENNAVIRGGDRVLWCELDMIEAKRLFSGGVLVRQTLGVYEDRSPELMEALKGDRASVIRAFCPDYQPGRHMVRLSQEECQASGIPIRVVEVFEIMEGDRHD